MRVRDGRGRAGEPDHAHHSRGNGGPPIFGGTAYRRLILGASSDQWIASAGRTGGYPPAAGGPEAAAFNLDEVCQFVAVYEEGHASPNWPVSASDERSLGTAAVGTRPRRWTLGLLTRPEPRKHRRGGRKGGLALLAEVLSLLFIFEGSSRTCGVG